MNTSQNDMEDPVIRHLKVRELHLLHRRMVLRCSGVPADVVDAVFPEDTPRSPSGEFLRKISDLVTVTVGGPFDSRTAVQEALYGKREDGDSHKMPPGCRRIVPEDLFGRRNRAPRYRGSPRYR